MNKKAELGESSSEIAEKSLFYPLMGFIITLLIVIFAWKTIGFTENATDVPLKLKAELLSQRFLNNPACFTYQDPQTGRIHPGIINLADFNEGKIFTCYHPPEEQGYEQLNFGLELKNQKISIKTKDYYHHTYYSFTYQVLVRKDNQLIPDQLIISVQEKI